MMPMAADSIIMEGARMTDEWPFIDQRIPDRRVVLTQSDPTRQFEIVEEEDDDFDDLGFSFTDSPEEAPKVDLPENRMTRNQMAVYELVNGQDSVDEMILESPLIEFETCKALADLVDRKIVREARQEEIAQGLLPRRSRVSAIEPAEWSAFPWLAVPLIGLLGFGTAGHASEPDQSEFPTGRRFGIKRCSKSLSWLRMVRLSTGGGIVLFLDGLYPESASDLLDSAICEGHQRSRGAGPIG